MQRHSVAPCIFHCTQMQNFCTMRSHFKSFFVCEVIKFVCCGDDARISGKYAIHIRINFAHICAKSRSERNGCGVRTASSESRHVFRLTIHALETSDNSDLAFFEYFFDASRGDADDLRFTVDRIREQPSLRACVRMSVHASIGHSHSKKGHRNAFAHRKKKIHFALDGFRFHNRCCQIDKIISCIAHCGDDHHHIVSSVMSLNDAFSNALN
ncbi:Uncharacterised protein [Chlamydia trachomatis]|nr:Uncharacterised protein [Chlamydia trachomatis]